MSRVTDDDIVSLKFDGLVDKIEDVERRIFHNHFPKDPKELYKKLHEHEPEITSLKSRGIINPEKYKLIFPVSRETDSRMLDITTIHALLRNFCDYKKPSTGWDKEPKKSDKSEIANLIRLNRGRHKGRGHIPKFLRTNDQFKKLYQDLKQPFLDLGCTQEELDNLLRFKHQIQYKFTPPVQEFTARKKELQEIHTKLQSSKYSTGRMGLVIHALAGVGKSEISKKYFQEYTEYYNNNVVWINAASLEDSFQDLAEFLKIRVKKENGDYQHIDRTIQDVHNYLADDKVLFIFDNADRIQTEKIKKYLPTSKQNFSLITSQVSKWSSSYFESFALRMLAKEEALEFVTQELSNVEESCEALQGIITFLDGHLLALKQFTTYINETGTSLEDYLVLIKAQPLQLTLDEEQNAIKAIKLNITKMMTDQRADTNELAQQILHCMRFMDGKEISRGFFFYLNFGHASNAELNRANINRALCNLERYSLIKINQSNQQKADHVISIHSLVQKTLQIIQETNNKDRKMYKHLLSHFIHTGDKEFLHMKEFDFNHFNYWYRQFVYIYNNKKFQDEFLKEIANHVHYFTDVLTNRCEFATCKDILDVLTDHEICANNVTLLYKVQFCKGVHFTMKREFDQSVKIYEEVLNEQQKKFGQSDRDCLRTLLQYGKDSLEKGDYEKSYELLSRLAQIQRIVLDENHVERLSCAGALAVCRFKQQKQSYKDSREELQVLLEKQFKIYHKPHPALSETQCYLWYVTSINSTEDGQMIISECLQDCLQMFPKTHPLVIEVQIALYTKEDIALNLDIFEEALAGFRSVYGEEHRRVSGLKFLISKICRQNENLGDEQSLLSSIMDILQQSTQQSLVIYVKAFLLCNLIRQNNRKKALQILQELIDGIDERHEAILEFKKFIELAKENKVKEVSTIIRLFEKKILNELLR